MAAWKGARGPEPEDMCCGVAKLRRHLGERAQHRRPSSQEVKLSRGGNRMDDIKDYDILLAGIISIYLQMTEAQ
jgi:hypothetical protein